jgi:RNA polymerase sigma-70 factor, ECF subfamily
LESVPDDLRQALTAVLPRLRRFGLTLTGSASDADDLVQNTCERALKHADQLREITRLDAWLYGIMRNVWIDEMRHRRVRRHDDIDAASNVIGEDGQATADGRITLDAVRRVMSQLPTDHRAVLMLVCVDGLSYKQAAEILGIPVGTIMSRLSRARQDLHGRLTGSANPDIVTPFSPRRVEPPTRARPV